MCNFVRSHNSSENYLKIIWDSSENYLRIILKSSENHLKIIWNSSENYLRIIWELSENYLKIIWKSSESYLKLIWELSTRDRWSLEWLSRWPDQGCIAQVWEMHCWRFLENPLYSCITLDGPLHFQIVTCQQQICRVGLFMHCVGPEQRLIIDWCF